MTTKTRSNTKPLQVLLAPEDHAKFKTLCSVRGLKMTEVTKELIEEWIAKELQKSHWLK